jgi:hypothetical protein
MSKKGYSEFEWEVRDSRNGDETLKLGGRLVYSSYNPLTHIESTARRLIEKGEEEDCDHVIIIGLGLGYLPRSLYNSGIEKIIVWEPFPVMQESFPVCSGDWRGAVIVVNEYGAFEKAVNQFAGRGSRPKLIIHPGYEIFCRLEYRLAVQTLDKIYNRNREGSYVISPRSLESLVRLPFLGTVKEFEGAFKDKKAVLVNPGPTLKQCVHLLKGMNDIIVFASLQSASYLQKNGIRVNFVVCADPKDMSPFTAECDDDFDAFFAETSVDPGSLDWKREKTFLYHFRCGQIHEMLWEREHLPVIEDPASSVSEVMLLLADQMGFNEIYCVGVDFCWKENRYTHRTNYIYDNDRRINDTMSHFQVMTSDNQVATTQSLYFHGARFMRHKCSELKRRGTKVYQIAGGIGFTSDGIINTDELEKKLHSGTDRVIVNIIKQQSPIDIDQVDRLLHDIKLGRIKRRQTDQDAGKMWPFLQGVPLAEQPDTCDIFINKLRSTCIAK